jgi:hypothetical protein
MTGTPRMTVDEYRAAQGLPPRGQREMILTNDRMVSKVVETNQRPIGKAHHALGRQPSDQMNKTEARFEREWIAPRKAAGEIVWSAFNSVKVRIAQDRCWLTIDFIVQFADGRFAAIDVKGAKAITEEDAKVKMKVAAGAFPFEFKFAFPRPRKLGGGWLIQGVK